MPEDVTVQRAYLKWVITTCKQAFLFSIYLLLCHTEELYLQFKINFTCELKSIIQKKKLKIFKYYSPTVKYLMVCASYTKINY